MLDRVEVLPEERQHRAKKNPEGTSNLYSHRCIQNDLL